MKLIYISNKKNRVYKILFNPISPSLNASGASNFSFHIPSKTLLPFVYSETKAPGKTLNKINSINSRSSRCSLIGLSRNASINFDFIDFVNHTGTFNSKYI